MPIWDQERKTIENQMIILQGINLIGGYGGPNIIDGCNLQVEQGKISVIVGPNGAGKSTALKALLGLLPFSKGEIYYKKNPIKNCSTQDRIAKGLGFVPQIENVFPNLTVEENLEIGAFLRKDKIQSSKQEIFDLFSVLEDKKKVYAKNLSGGQRQQLAFARALMTKPEVLLLDEPTAGVSPIVMDDLFEKILDIAKQGIAVMICEQNAEKALQIADLGFVIVQGKNRFTDSGKNLLSNKEVRKSFLGL